MSGPKVLNAPDRIWLQFGDLVTWCDESVHDTDVRYVRGDLYEANAQRMARDSEALEAEVERLREALTRTAANLAAAIILLERGGKAAKKAAASDKMFDIMLTDYHKALAAARAALAGEGGDA